MQSKSVTSETASCTHHWILSLPDGLETAGVCKLCGAERRFSNESTRQLAQRVRTAKK